MVTGVLKDVKVTLKLAEGSQTISGCSHEATDEQLYALGKAVSKLEAQGLEDIVKITETALINQ